MDLIKKILNTHILSPVIFLLCAIFITYPLIFHLGDLAVDLGDSYLVSFIMNWVNHAIFSNPLDLFNAPIYFPYINSLAFSEPFISSSILSLIPLKLIGEPMVAVNFTLITSIFMVGYFTFLLSFYITKNFLASLISGLLLIFSPVFLDKQVHLQILSIQWVPLSILFFLKFVNESKAKFLCISLLIFILQIYNSFLPAYFLIFFYVIYITATFFYKRPVFKKIFVKRNIILFILTFLIIIPLLIPYFQNVRNYDTTRDIKDSIHFALQPEDLIYSNQQTRLQPILISISNLKTYTRYDEIKYGYIGLAFSILGVLSLIFAIKKIKDKNLLQQSFLLTGLLGLILSFGPALHFNRQTIHSPFPIILPYALFYYIIPGFNGLRNSERFEVMFIFCLAILIGIFLDRVFKKIDNRKRVISYAFIIALIVLEFNFPQNFYPILQRKDFPKVYSYLNTTPKDSAYITMPIYNWNSPDSQIELQREYYSTQSFRKAVNGYSGFSPASWQEDVLYLFNNFPKSESVSKIKKMGVNYIVVNKEEYDSLFSNKFYSFGNGEKVLSVLETNSDLELIEQIDNTYVYSFKK